jgi:hypothetical protein
MTIKTWKASQFIKQKNSTKQPGSSPTPTSYTVRLKDPTSITRPTIIFDGHIAPTDIGYAYIDDFERYYFVSEYRYNGPNTEIDFVSDPLASFKNEIEDYEGHIARCSDYTWYNNMIPDPLNPIASGADFYGAAESGSSPFSSSAFCFILSVIGKSQISTAQNGMATTYCISISAMEHLIDDFNNASFLQNLINEFTNPLDAIVSCKIVPLVYGSSLWPATEYNVYIGTQSTSAMGKIITGRAVNDAITINLPAGATSITGYRKAEPYATYSAYLPFVGVVGIKYENVAADNKLHIARHMDIMSGDISYDIVQDSQVIATYSGSFATNIPMSNKSYSGSGVIGGVMATLGGIVGAAVAAYTGGAALPAVGAIAAGIGGTVTSLEQKTQINGMISSYLGVQSGIYCRIMCLFRKLASTITDHQQTEGLPCHKTDYVRSHSGYLQMLNPSVKCTRATAGELDEINATMASGFFYQ